MKHLMKCIAFAVLLSTLEGCFTKKQFINALSNLQGMEQICYSEPVKYSFDPNNSTNLKVQVSVSNANSVDVTGSFQVELLLRDKNDVIIGYDNSIFTTPVVVFPKNQTIAYTTPFIDITCSKPLEVGEKYIIEARKYGVGASYNRSVLNTSCSNYRYAITLK